MGVVRTGWRRRFLARGESVVALSGAMLAAVLVITLVASGWWSLREHARSMDDAQAKRVLSVGDMLGRQIETLLSRDELSRARTLIADTAQRNGLTRCRIVLPGSRVLADTDTSHITDTGLPSPWPSGQATRPEAAEGNLSYFRPLEFSDGRAGALYVEFEPARQALLNGPLALGLGIIGVGGLVLWLATYRHVRNRLRGLGAVSDALAAAASGEDSWPVLEVSGRYGPEARAWNRLLAERETLREKVLSEKVAEKLTGAGGSAGDSELAGACDALWMGLVILDEKSRVQYINGAGAVLLGVRREDAVGSALSDHVKEEKALEAVRGAAGGQARQRTTVEIERQATSGRTVLRFTVRAMRKGDSAAAVVVVEDVTQQRVADDSRNSFVTQVTHELRTPLTNIGLYLETLTDPAQTDAAVKAKCINVIQQETKRLERVVSDMLSVAEIEAGSLKLYVEDVRLDALFEELRGDYQAQAQDKEITLALELPPKLPVIRGDREKVMLALHNLVGNALKYTPQGGQIRVQVETDDQGVTVAVADNGIGIKPEEQELIFEKFYRAKDRRIAGITGSGLGLALARQVVRLHGGDITVRSAIDKGSTFTLTLPMGKAA